MEIKNMSLYKEDIRSIMVIMKMQMYDKMFHD